MGIAVLEDFGKAAARGVQVGDALQEEVIVRLLVMDAAALLGGLLGSLLGGPRDIETGRRLDYGFVAVLVHGLKQ